MYRVICPVCKAGFEAKFTRENCAINCVTCGVAFNASHYLPKAESPRGQSASAVKSAVAQRPARYTGPVLIDPPQALAHNNDSTHTLGLPFVDLSDSQCIESGGVATLEAPRPPKRELTPLPVLSKVSKGMPEPILTPPVKKQSAPDIGVLAKSGATGNSTNSESAGASAPKDADAHQRSGTAVITSPQNAPKPGPVLKSGPVLKPGPVLVPGPVMKAPPPTNVPSAPQPKALDETLPTIAVPTPAPKPVIDSSAPVMVAPATPAIPARGTGSRGSKGRRPLLEGIFSHYEIEGEIARGGVGAVFRARDKETGKPFALKVLIDGEEAGETERERFRHECETAKALSLPGMVQIHEVGECDGRPFMAMELVEGKSLDKVIAEKTLGVDDCLILMKSVAETVGALHEAGYVHRDLKPGNILLDAFGSPKVADFGLVKSLDEVTRMTASGLVCGTPAYMSPEQARGEGRNVDPRSDVWALGAVLYEMLAGEPPFKADNALKLMLRITKEQPRKLSMVNRKVPSGVEAIVTKCLEKKAALRYANGRELAADITAFREGKKLRVETQPRMSALLNNAIANRKTLLPVFAAVAALVLIALVAKLAMTERDAAPAVERGFLALSDTTLTPAEKLNRAERNFREALLIEPKNARAYMGLGLCLARRGIDPQKHVAVNPALVREAFKMNDYAAVLDPKLQPETSANAARYNMWLNDHVAEAAQLERAVKGAPSNLKYRESLGLAYWNAGAQTRSVRYYQSAVKTFEAILVAEPQYPKVGDYIRQIYDKFLSQGRSSAMAQ